MILINFDTPLSQMTPKEIQFIQLSTKHEISLISYHEVCDLLSRTCKSFDSLDLFL